MDCIPYNTKQLLGAGRIYRALGYYTAPGADPRYILAVPNGLRAYRGPDIGGVSALLDLWPDADHWRRLYPKGAHGIDAYRARAAIMRECQEAGPYLPPLELRPYKSGTRRDRGAVRHDWVPESLRIEKGPECESGPDSGVKDKA